MTISAFDIATSDTPGFKTFQITGTAVAVDTDTAVMLGPNLGPAAAVAAQDTNSIHLLDSSGILTVERSDPADTGRVAVLYLDEDWAERVAVYEMDAASKTLDVLGASHTARRVNQARYVAGGNAGNIDFRIGGDLINRIGAGDGLARCMIYTVPAGQRVMLTGFLVASQAGRPVDLWFYAKIPGAQPYVLNRLPARETFEFVDLPIPRRIRDLDFSVLPPDEITHGIDLYFQVQRQAGAANTADVAGTMTFLAQQTGLDPAAPGFTSTRGI